MKQVINAQEIKFTFEKNNQTVIPFKAFHVYAQVLRRFKIFFNSIYLV